MPKTNNEPSPPPPIIVQNLVYTCPIGIPVNLADVAQRLTDRGLGIEYNPKKFAAVIVRSRKSPRKIITRSADNQRGESSTIRKYRIHKKTADRDGHEFYKHPKIATLIFSPGKLVCTGAKTASQARRILRYKIELLQQIGYKKARLTTLNLENMVGSTCIPGGIDRAQLARDNSSFCNYAPESFPGVIIRYPPIRPMTILVFKSGKIVITGARSMTNATDGFSSVLPILLKYVIDRSVSGNLNYTHDPYIRPSIDINKLIETYAEKGDNLDLDLFKL